MQNITYQTLSYTNSATSTADFFGYSNRVMIKIDSPTSHFSNGATTMVLQGNNNSGATMQDLFFYDYIGLAANLCQVTAATEGIYEMPNPGACHEYRIRFTTDATTPGTLTILYPRDAY